MDENNKDQKNYSFPNSDRPLDSKEPTPMQTSIQNGGSSMGKGVSRDTIKYNAIANDPETAGREPLSDEPRIETYKIDVERVLKNDNLSALQVAVAEQKKQQENTVTEEVKKEKKSGSWIAISSACLFILTIILAGYVYWQKTVGQTAPISALPDKILNLGKTDTTPQIKDLIKIEQKEQIHVDGSDYLSIKNNINKVKSAPLQEGTIKEIALYYTPRATEDVPVQSPAKISPRLWFTALQARETDELVRGLGTNYTMGIYQSANGAPIDSFVIFELASYDSAYSGMLSWERYIIQDLSGIFERVFPIPVQKTNADIASTTGLMIATSTNQSNSSSTKATSTAVTAIATSTVTNMFTNREFVDRIYFNKDTRTLYDDQNRVRLLYTFIDSKTLVITSSETALEEIISRLTTGKIVR